MDTKKEPTTTTSSAFGTASTTNPGAPSSSLGAFTPEDLKTYMESNPNLDFTTVTPDLLTSWLKENASNQPTPNPET